MNQNDKVNLIKIDAEKSILSALKQMDLTFKRLLLVFEHMTFKGVLSIGDIQRAIIRDIDLSTPVKAILRKNIEMATPEESYEQVKNRMLKLRTECMPVVDKENNLIDVYFWEDVFGDKKDRIFSTLNIPVIIMAGGEGKRLKPITNVIPKALIPIGEKTMLEEIMDRFLIAGCNQFYISVNYRADMIKHYFEKMNNARYNIEYFQENKPLGTAGSLYLLKDKIHSTFFVSNCDIIVDQDYEEIYNYHKENQNDLTVVVALKHFSLPYGTIESGKNGVLKSLSEKPEITFKVNTGMYLLEPGLLKEIPENKFLHITQLISIVKKRNGNIGIFPVSENSWKDIGEWNQYLKFLKL